MNLNRQRIWETEFPSSSSNWGVYFPIIGRYQNGEAFVRKQVKQSNLLNPVLVATPETKNQYLPPSLIPGKMGEQACNKIKTDRHEIMVIALVFLFLITFVLWFVANPTLALGWFSFNLVFCLYFHFDNKTMFNNPEVLKERAMFYGWLYLRGNNYLVAAIFLFFTVGLLQLGLIKAMGSNDLVLERFGLHYIRVTEDGQWWRLVSGLFLHAKFVHWLSNMMIAAGLFMMCGPFLKTRRLIPVFLGCALGSFVTVYSAHLMSLLDTDGLIGLSGGLGGVLGWFVVSNYRCCEIYPRQFYLTSLYFASIALLVLPMFISFTTFLCHLSGLVLGGLAALPIDKETFVKQFQV